MRELENIGRNLRVDMSPSSAGLSPWTASTTAESGQKLLDPSDRLVTRAAT